jgi:pyruvate dehydrogenase E2 component (dihydrolipoamide acetyltransferase)
MGATAQERSTDVVLIQDGMSMESAVVLVWNKAPGDHVHEGEVLGEVETAKTALEILAPVSGILRSFLAQPGDEVPVRAVLAIIDPPSTRPSRRQITPRARRLARELKIDLCDVPSSRPSGRVTENDVRAMSLGELDPVVHDASRVVRPPSAPSPTPNQPAATGDSAIPLNGMRGAIATRMVASLHTMAQFTVTTEADVTDLAARRRNSPAELGVSFTHLVVRACALALQQHPRLNATIEDDQICLQDHCDIGIAVALEEGLVVPVLRRVENLSLRGVVAGADEIVDQVRAGRGGSHLFTGGTFTVSNLGGYGVDTFTPIVNPPQVGILGMGRIVERPVHSEETFLAWRSFMSLSLTVDHRGVDGVPAALFLQTVARHLEDPSPLFT